MSLYRQKTALLVNGICPICRRDTIECKSIPLEEGFFDWKHYYHCDPCGLTEDFIDSEIKLAWQETQHWDSMPSFEKV